MEIVRIADGVARRLDRPGLIAVPAGSAVRAGPRHGDPRCRRRARWQPPVDRMVARTSTWPASGSATPSPGPPPTRAPHKFRIGDAILRRHSAGGRPREPLTEPLGGRGRDRPRHRGRRPRFEPPVCGGRVPALPPIAAAARSQGALDHGRDQAVRFEGRIGGAVAEAAAAELAAERRRPDRRAERPGRGRPGRGRLDDRRVRRRRRRPAPGRPGDDRPDHARPGLINLDFADVRSVMQDAGPALIGLGRGTGEHRATDAADRRSPSPLLEASIEGARGILFNVSARADLRLREVRDAAEAIRERADPEANVIFGASFSEPLGQDVLDHADRHGADHAGADRAAARRGCCSTVAPRSPSSPSRRPRPAPSVLARPPGARRRAVMDVTRRRGACRGRAPPVEERRRRDLAPRRRPPPPRRRPPAQHISSLRRRPRPPRQPQRLDDARRRPRRAELPAPSRT